MHIKAKTPFSWAHRGCDIEHFEAGQVIDTADEDLVRVATDEGWAEAFHPEGAAEEVGGKAGKPASNKASKTAPENK